VGGYGDYTIHFAKCLDLTTGQVFGNLVKGQRIAGLVYIVQESTQFLQGFITSIDFATGHFFVDNSVECLLNDVRY
jgi:hypothetical protein